jgi:serine/threonine protein kinase
MVPFMGEARQIEAPRSDKDADRWLLGRYRLEQAIGHGGGSVVYRAWDAEFEDRVALKLWEDGDVRHQRGEATAIDLRHPHIIRVLQAGRCERGRPFLAMELLQGTLQDHIGRDGLAWDVLSRIADQLLDALSHAHERGIVHRDIKPSNLLLTASSLDRADVRVGDFGLAIAHGPAEAWAAETVEGTPRYMAPEQAVGEPVDARTDVYSAGVVIFEALTGTPPFSGDGPLDLLRAHISQLPPSLSELRPDLPAAVVETVAWMLEKDPAQRCPSATRARGLLASAGSTGSTGSLDSIPVGLEMSFGPSLEAALPDLPELPRPARELPRFVSDLSGPPEVGVPPDTDQLWRRYGLVMSEDGTDRPFFVWIDGLVLGPLSLDDFLHVWERETPSTGFASLDARTWTPFSRVAALLDRLSPASPLDAETLAEPASWEACLRGFRSTAGRTGTLQVVTGHEGRRMRTALHLVDGAVVHVQSDAFPGTGLEVEQPVVEECLRTGESLWQVQFGEEGSDSFRERLRKRMAHLWEGALVGWTFAAGASGWRGPARAGSAWSWLLASAAEQSRLRGALGPQVDRVVQLEREGLKELPEPMRAALEGRWRLLEGRPLYQALAEGVEPGLAWALHRGGVLRLVD